MYVPFPRDPCSQPCTTLRDPTKVITSGILANNKATYIDKLKHFVHERVFGREKNSPECFRSLRIWSVIEISELTALLTSISMFRDCLDAYCQ